MVKLVNKWLIRMLKQRVITAAVLLVFFIAVFFAASESVFQLVMAVVAAAAAYEWASLSGHNTRNSQIISIVTGVVVLVVNGFLVASGFVFFTAWVAFVFWCYVLHKLRTAPVLRSIRSADWLSVIVGSLLLVATVASMQHLRFHAPNASSWLLLYCMGLVWVMDTGAYFAGKRFGRNKLAPSISPGKTREGMIGGMAAACSLFLLTALFGRWPEGSLWAVLLASLAAAPFSVAGDLYESRIKRAAGAKDSSDLLPGHGGVLDRIDGLLPTVPMFTAIYLLLVPAG